MSPNSFNISPALIDPSKAIKSKPLGNPLTSLSAGGGQEFTSVLIQLKGRLFLFSVYLSSQAKVKGFLSVGKGVFAPTYSPL